MILRRSSSYAGQEDIKMRHNEHESEFIMSLQESKNTALFGGKAITIHLLPVGDAVHI
jgi:hypothetical protein